MSDTIDRLVRIMDEERQMAARARENAGHARSRQMQTESDNRRLEMQLEEAEKNIKEWRAYAGHLLSFIPKKKVDALVQTPPSVFVREIPF